MIMLSPKVSIIMPTYNQSAFISRAIKSLLLQTFHDWEMIIINDGSTDDTESQIQVYLGDERIRYYKIDKNEGLGYAINMGLQKSKCNLISYLPSDDIYFRNHLQSLYDVISENDECILTYSRITNNRIAETEELLKLDYLQIVQVMHRKTSDKWVERNEFVTDNLYTLFWGHLSKNGLFLPTDEITAQWVEHPLQHNKIVREDSSGGLPMYRSYYQVQQPIKFQSSFGSLNDEVELYKLFRQKPNNIDSNHNRLKILLVGELAYNAERIYALEQYGHKLYGLWIQNPNFYNTIGPLPFGNIENIPYDNSWKEKVEEIKPDIIYALLNFQAIPFARHIMKDNITKIPFVWHFKEGPFFSQRFGTWKQLIELFRYSDGVIFINEENKDWYSQFITFNSPTYVLDGDLPKIDWFTNKQSELLSNKDGEIHTVIPGRPYGINPYELKHLAIQKVHIHIYGEHYHSTWKNWITVSKKVADDYIHLHSNCTPAQWVEEFSKYDAGWLHSFNSNNKGEMMKATWNDLNYPARMNTLAAAGLPMIQKNNYGNIVATQNLVKRLNVGVYYDEIENIRDAFEDQISLGKTRDNVWKQRQLFSFDYYVDNLTNFFIKVINNKR